MATITTTPVLRPKTDRLLIAILLGIAGLLVGAGIAVVLSRQPVPQLPADTPGGVVQQFYVALGQEDYDKAYGLLSDSMIAKPTRETFVAYFLGDHSYGYTSAAQNSRIRITSEKTYGAVGVVEVEITHYSGNPGPFGGSSEWRNSQTFTLHQEARAWRISELPFAFRP